MTLHDRTPRTFAAIQRSSNVHLSARARAEATPTKGSARSTSVGTTQQSLARNRHIGATADVGEVLSPPLAQHRFRPLFGGCSHTVHSLRCDDAEPRNDVA